MFELVFGEFNDENRVLGGEAVAEVGFVLGVDRVDRPREDRRGVIDVAGEGRVDRAAESRAVAHRGSGNRGARASFQGAGLKRGDVDGLVLQDPFQMGYEAVKRAINAAEGREVNRGTLHTNLRVATRENVDSDALRGMHTPELERFLPK